MRHLVDVLETSPASAASLQRVLSAAGFTTRVHDGLRAYLRALESSRPSALLLDLAVKGMAGRELIRALRSEPRHRRLVIVAVTGRRRPGEAEKVFAAGADEYLVRPVDPELLRVRLASLLRRVPPPADEERWRCGPITLAPAARSCRVAQAPVRLSRLEYDILLLFVKNPGRVFTRGYLIDVLWKGDQARGSRAVDRQVSALRAKLGAGGRLLETLVGVGYCLRAGKRK